MNNVLLILLDALRTWTVPTWLEIVGFVFGISGGLAFVFPDQVGKLREYICCCCGSDDDKNSI